MRRPIRIRFALLGVITAGVLAACGGGGGDPVTGSDGGTNDGGAGTGGGTSNPPVAGGGGGTTDPTGCVPTVKSGFPQDLATLSWDTGLGADVIGEGQGGADGGGGFGVGGSLGKFIDADVRVTKFDGSDAVLGTARTDDTGMVTVNTCGYDGPLLVTFEGNDVARYVQERLDTEDPTQRDITRFKSGERLRVAVGAVERNVGVSPYTEAAVSYLEKSIIVPKDVGGSVSPKAMAQEIEAANDRVAAILADQLPTVYRPESARGDGKFKLTQLPVLIDERQGTEAGTLDNDARGISGAVNAGFGIVADTFLPRNEQLGDDQKSPSAVIAARQLAQDLDDGKLDMVGSDGPVAATGSPAYTYETLWRAKTIGTARTAEAAGTSSLAQTTAVDEVEVAHYGLSSFETYKSRVGDGTEVLRRTDYGQTVTLDSGGRLKLERRMGAQIGDLRNYVEELVEHDLSALYFQRSRFVEVKVGSMGEIIALTQDRKSLVYVDPAVIYRVTGSENVDQGRAALREAVTTLNHRIFQLGGDDLRVISFTPAPAARVYAPDPGAAPPAILAVKSDGGIEAVFPNATWTDSSGLMRPFSERWGGARVLRLAAPTRLQTVVFDKFALPGHTAAYGPVPSNVSLPWGGPRRLFGLTREGKVVVWLEGYDAPGTTLNIPGVVIQLNADSRTGVYALTSDGRVFWVNADQAYETPPLSSVDAADPPRRQRALDNVVEVPFPAGAGICWIGAEQAIDCAAGRAYAWEEVNSSMSFAAAGSGGFIGPGTDGVGRIPVPVDVDGAQAVTLNQVVGRLWRLTAVEHLDLVIAGSNPRAVRLGGLKYLSADGRSADKATVGPQRNILSDLICELETASKSCPLDQQFAYITGAQLRDAIRASLREFAGASAGLKNSFFPLGFTSSFYSRDVLNEPGRFVLDNLVRQSNGEPDPTRPRMSAGGSFGVGDGRMSLRLESLDSIDGAGNSIGFPLNNVYVRLDDRAQYAQNGASLNIGDSDRIRLDRTLASWDTDGSAAATLRGLSNYPDSLGNESHRFYVRLIPGVLITRSFGFRVCWEVRVETPDNGNGRKTCTHHRSDGSFVGLTVIDARFDGQTQSGPRIDFGDAGEDGTYTVVSRP